jgi:hypothetical protein
MIDRETIEFMKAGERAGQAGYFGLLDDIYALWERVLGLESEVQLLTRIIDELAGE